MRNNSNILACDMAEFGLKVRFDHDLELQGRHFHTYEILKNVTVNQPDIQKSEI